jgi:hypothetical protein
MGIQLYIQKTPVQIRYFRAHDLTRKFKLFLMTPRDGVLLITGFLCLSLLCIVLVANHGHLDPAISAFTSVPEPSSFALMAVGVSLRFPQVKDDRNQALQSQVSSL